MMYKLDTPAIEPGGLVRGSRAHSRRQHEPGAGRRHWSPSTDQWSDSRVYDMDDNGMVDVVDTQRRRDMGVVEFGVSSVARRWTRKVMISRF